jgi:hypothetical protein
MWESDMAVIVGVYKKKHSEELVLRVRGELKGTFKVRNVGQIFIRGNGNVTNLSESGDWEYVDEYELLYEWEMT